MGEIVFMGDQNEGLSSTSSAEAPSANVGSNGPIQSPVEDSGSTMETSDLQKYGTVPSQESGSSIEFSGDEGKN